MSTTGDIQMQTRVLELAGVPRGWAALLELALLAALIALAIWLYRREARAGASARLRGALATLRAAVLLVLAAVWLEPVIATYIVRRQVARTIVLADMSESMAIADTPAKADGPAPTRAQRVAALMQADRHAWLRQLAQRNDVALYVFGAHTTPVRLPDDVQPSPATQPAASAPAGEPATPPAAVFARAFRPLGAVTDLGQAVSAAVERAGDSPLAAVIVLTDGNVNRGMTPRDIAAYLRRFRVPVYAVGVGSPVEPPNLRISDFVAPTTTPLGDPFEVRLAVVGAGVAAGQVTVELWGRPADAPEAARLLERRSVRIGPEHPRAELRFALRGEKAGRFGYRARVVPLPGEAIEFDNQREVVVSVVDEKLRVLLVSGRPSYEYRYLARLLERDRTIDVSCWLQSADPRAVRDGDTIITELPRRPEDLFAYDVILLLDPDGRELDSAWAITVRHFVDELGGGLLLEAGSHFTRRLVHDPRLDELTAMLPVVFDPEADVRLSEQGAFHTRAWPLAVPTGAAEHPLLRLDPDAQRNRSLWEHLPGVWWYWPVLREKPLATVLLRYGNRALATRFGLPVLAAIQPFGAGRTAFLAWDGTWRWRATAESVFDRFWIQLVRYLAQARRQGLSKHGTIVLDRETIRPGDYVKVEARVLDHAFVPWHASAVVAQLVPVGRSPRELTLEAIPGQAGWFRGRFTADWTGSAVVRLPLPDAGDTGQSPALVKHLRVEGSDIELRTLRLQEEALKRLAQQTGGRYIPLDQASELPERIPDASHVRTTRGADRPLWDRAWVMLLVAMLLGVEWALRRRNHLL